MTSLPTERKITSLLQDRPCGKPGCRRCQQGPGHGPYWYTYWREPHRTRSGYGGQALPAGFHQAPRQHTHQHTTEEAYRCTSRKPACPLRPGSGSVITRWPWATAR